MIKKKRFYTIPGFFIVALFLLNGCSPEEKIVEKQMIQLGEDDIREADDAVYRSRQRGERTYTYLAADLSGYAKPASLDEFTTYFHTPPIRQDRTGTCWCFATTSFFESELKRLGKGEFKLSEMYTAYWEFLEKARGFIQKKGDQQFVMGSEHNAVILRMKQYGAVPASDYTGLLPGQTEHDHSQLFREINNYLNFCKENEYWNEEQAVAYVRSILDKYLGRPPEIIEVDGKPMTPLVYLENVLELPLDDYVSFISTTSFPFYTKGEYKVPDNWWHSEDYYNIPLEEFYAAIENALNNGYTVDLGGDVSEPGIQAEEDIAVVPTFDIHPLLITQDSREYRFANRTSTDDHAIHAVGIKQGTPHTWFLIKDSGGGAHRGNFEGYYFYRDDFIKLKMLSFTIHKDAVKDILAKFDTEGPQE